mmetsp:Transcript_8619/g.15609  ORF Transcript_8619/g.15609 Transcript_8619/m.15609 type:complete len:218 (+) Transcript_8619:1089-1742(+)
MISATVSVSLENNKSRIVTIPRRGSPMPDMFLSLSCFSVTRNERQTPSSLSSCIFRTCATVRLGEQQKGLDTINVSARLTWRTMDACSSMLTNRCKTPIPPLRAISIAILASQTVSILAATIGLFKTMFLLKCVVREISLRLVTVLCSGLSKTSLYVMASGNSSHDILFMKVAPLILCTCDTYVRRCSLSFLVRRKGEMGVDAARRSRAAWVLIPIN